MKFLIIEDEPEASQRLARMLKEVEPHAEVVGFTDSISGTLKWLKSNELPDAALVDIHLADGPSFEIFKQNPVKLPVIFTTAYDEYALQAFKLHSVDYLLKPIKKADLQRAVQKLKEWMPKTIESAPAIDYTQLAAVLQQNKIPAKRLVTKIGQHLKVVETQDVAYFYTENKISYACTKEHPKLPLDQTMDELEKIAEPHIFFRINRQFIVNIKAIANMVAYSKGRVKLSLNPPINAETIVSTERAAEFKKWLGGV